MPSSEGSSSSITSAGRAAGGDTGADLVGRRRRIDRARGSGGADPVVADAVRGSWLRCEGAVATTSTAPVVLDDPGARWADSPIRRAAGSVLDELAALARREDYVAAITDAEGRIIWSTAGATMRRRAERANFVDGSDWCETAAGTNAPGLTLRTGRVASVFASEHWCDGVRDWVCYSAPIRDAGGRMAGVLDLSAHWRHASPLALTTVDALARLIEIELRTVAPPALEIRVLGPTAVRHEGEPVALTMRQLEVLTVLAHRGAVGRDELQALVWGDRPVSPSTVKAEISHLRSLLGSGIESRPYRLVGAAVLDVSVVLDALGRGDVETALRAYRGPLLPTSESPYLVDLRHHVDVALRAALLRSGSADQLLRFGEHHREDFELLERAIAIAPAGTGVRDEAHARLGAALR